MFNDDLELTITFLLKKFQKLIWSILVMLVVMTGVTGGLVLLLRWLKGMWIAWARSC